jgi:uncharacterized protein YlzI (FlbEa/FlbD family)
LRYLPEQMELVPYFVSSTIQLIHRGYVDDVLKLLSTELADVVEPLAVAIKMYSGQKPVVAKEVEEVASDILQRIETARPVESLREPGQE